MLKKQVCKLNWIAEPERSLLSDVTFIISILVVFPQSAKKFGFSSIQVSTIAFLFRPSSKQNKKKASNWQIVAQSEILPKLLRKSVTVNSRH